MTINRRSFVGRISAAAVGLLACFVPAVARPRPGPVVLSVAETDSVLDGLTCHGFGSEDYALPWTGWFENSSGEVEYLTRLAPDGGPALKPGEMLAQTAWGGDYALVPVSVLLGNGS